MSEYVQGLRERIRLNRMRRSQGWHDDAFVLGNEVYMPDDRVIGVNVRAGDAAEIHRTWLRYTALFGQKGMEPAALTLLLSLAAPLAGMAGINGLTVSPYSPSGYGKRCILRFATSLWSEPAGLTLEPGAMQTDRMNVYGAAGSLPVVHEGALLASKSEFEAMVAEYAMCRGKSALSARENTRTMQWSGFLFAPRPKPVQHDKANLRVFDYHLPYMDLRRNDLDEFSHIAGGVVGERYGRFLARHRKGIADKLFDARQKIAMEADFAAGLDWLVSLLACVEVAGFICWNILNLLDFTHHNAIAFAQARAVEISGMPPSSKASKSVRAEVEKIRARRRKSPLN